MPKLNPRRATPEQRQRLDLLALRIVAAGKSLPKPERDRSGLTWTAAAKRIGVSRRHLHRIAAQLRDEMLSRRQGA
jgi:hypothetical protein